MNTKKIRTSAVAGGTALTVVGAYVLAGPAALAAPPESLAVFFAGSTASPVGVVSRVPVETAGGLVLSSSQVQLGKSQALAAGGTLGELGDAFVVTSAPPGTITSFPSVVTAQDPPSETSPRQAELTGGRGGGNGMGQVRNLDLSARASDFPEAGANASGNAILSGLFSTGASVSRSVSKVLPDGTVTTEGFTAVQDIAIGAAPAQLTFASVASLASVVIEPGAEPVSTLQVRFSGAELAGMAVVLDEGGLRIADQVAAPASMVQMFNSAVAGLAAQGITVVATPSTKTESADSATVSGSAFSFRYQLPESPIPKPSDIGSDETFDFGSVSASATARARQALGGALDDGVGDAVTGPTAVAGTAPATGVDAAAAVPQPGAAVQDLPFAPAPAAPGSVPGGLPTVTLAQAPSGATDLAAPVGFAFPERPSIAPAQFRDGYRFVLLAALAGLLGLAAIVRKRPLF